ncbi:hypothetical protein [Helicobacter sp. 23-1045]
MQIGGGQNRLKNAESPVKSTKSAESSTKSPATISIENFEFSAYSQNGEDGIIDFLIEILDLENSAYPRAFVEFGVQNYSESNTRYLLKKRNFRGLVIDGSAKNVDFIRNDEIYWKFDLCAKCAFITRENINEIIKNWMDSAKLSNVAVLSVDIDGVDYFVWEAIECVRPAIVIVEYNALLGSAESKSVPYSAEFERFSADYSGLYFGASICALIALGEKKGMKFIGAESSGTNLFFVDSALAQKVDFLQIHSLDEYCKRHNARQGRDKNGNLNFIGGDERAKYLADKRFVDLR